MINVRSTAALPTTTAYDVRSALPVRPSKLQLPQPRSSVFSWTIFKMVTRRHIQKQRRPWAQGYQLTCVHLSVIICKLLN